MTLFGQVLAAVPVLYVAGGSAVNYWRNNSVLKQKMAFLG